jgi:hypothetical protein
LTTAAAPTRVSRTMAASTETAGRSTIVFDRSEGRFVNSTKARASEAAGATTGTGNGNAEQAQRGMKVYPAQNRGGNDARVPPATDR